MFHERLSMLTFFTDIGAIHKIGAPIHVYPLYENAFRAHRQQSLKHNNEESAQLYAEFAKVAEANEQAWRYGQEAANKDLIGTVGKSNRMICFPCELFTTRILCLAYIPQIPFS